MSVPLHVITNIIEILQSKVKIRGNQVLCRCAVIDFFSILALFYLRY